MDSRLECGLDLICLASELQLQNGQSYTLSYTEGEDRHTPPLNVPNCLKYVLLFFISSHKLAMYHKLGLKRLVLLLNMQYSLLFPPQIFDYTLVRTTKFTPTHICLKVAVLSRRYLSMWRNLMEENKRVWRAASACHVAHCDPRQETQRVTTHRHTARKAAG